ncbi:hypothetical protein [Salipiger mucosus]|uniref:HTH cro/C1-type domain-containing protein n=1 Tax=Salipiger mucosus DSM 16094 TaxID=1123237 RepID=S9QR32_9RHOB|nr:hypothetical protein [Salipiger mucosus]EPX82078.1 hypothetical protein Salmuc_02445 [Salipiger mucosus DSM 16094]
MSFETFFKGGRRVDLHAWQRTYPDRARAYFRASGMSAAQIAVVYGVTERTAMNWLEGVVGPKGDKIALIALRDRAGFERYFGEDAA